MSDRHGTEQTSRARPHEAGTEPDLGVVVEYQRIELKRVLKENQNLRGDIDRLLRLLERDQVIRQQEQQDRAAMLAVVERLAAERALPPPPPQAVGPAVAADTLVEAPPPDFDEDTPLAQAAESEIETSLSDLQEICDRLESVRAQAPWEAPNETAEVAEMPRAAKPAEPAGSPVETAPPSENEAVVGLLRKLNLLGGTDWETGPRKAEDLAADMDGPESAEARAKRVLTRLAALFERRQ